MSDELLNPADVAVDPDVRSLYSDADARLVEQTRIQQLVAATLRDAVRSVVELGVPEFVTVDKTIAQGEAGGQSTVSFESADFPDLITDGNWRLDGVCVVADSNATADLTLTITGLLPGVSIAVKAARTIIVGGQSTFVPLYRTIRSGEKPGEFNGLSCVVSGGATGDKAYLSFVFRKVRDVRVAGL